MRKYIDAELEIVNMSNDIIATSISANNEQGDGNQLVSERRSIWN